MAAPLTQQDKVNIKKCIYEEPTAQRVIDLLGAIGGTATGPTGATGATGGTGDLSAYLKRDGSTTGATGAAQEFTNGIESTSGNDKGSVTNSQIRSGDNTAQTESTLNKDGVVKSTSNVDSTYTQLHPDGSVWFAGKSGATIGAMKLYYKKISITSAQIQTGNTTPIVLVTAQGAGTAVYARHDTLARCVNGAVPVTATEMQIKDRTATKSMISFSGSFLNSTTGNLTMGDDSLSINEQSICIANDDLVAFFDADNPLYDGTIDIYLWYTIITL